MKKLITFAMPILILLTGCATTGLYNATLDHLYAPNNQSEETPVFSFHALSIADPDFSPDGVLEVIVNIPYSQLRFVKAKTGGFYAPYEVDAWLLHSGYQTASRHLSKKAFAPNYRMTRTSQFSVLPRIQFNVPTEIYLIRLRVTNTQSNEISEKTFGVRKRDIILNSFNISDLIFVRNSVDGETFFNALLDTLLTTPLTAPLNSQLLDPWTPVNACFKVYFPPKEWLSLKGKNVVVQYALINKRNETVFESEQQIQVPETEQKTFVAVPIALNESSGNGWYKLKLQAHIKDNAADTIVVSSATVEKAIQFFSYMPRSEEEQKVMLKAIKLIAPRDFKKGLKRTKTDENRLKLFNAFWKRQTIGLRADLYDRIAYVLKRYHGFRGEKPEIILKFGFPDEITNVSIDNLMVHPMDPVYGHKEFETWHYYGLRSAIYGRDHKMFKFPKQGGFGINTRHSHPYNDDELNDYNPEKIFR